MEHCIKTIYAYIKCRIYSITIITVDSVAKNLVQDTHIFVYISIFLFSVAAMTHPCVTSAIKCLYMNHKILTKTLCYGDKYGGHGV